MIRKFSITPVLNGYIVEIGCQHIVFTDRTHLMESIKSYLLFPDATEKTWKEESLNSEHFFDLTSCNQPIEPPQTAVCGQPMN